MGHLLLDEEVSDTNKEDQVDQVIDVGKALKSADIS
jgi:hypothetical protein